MHEVIEKVAGGIEAVAVAIIVGGIALAFARFCFDRPGWTGMSYRRFKNAVGASLLLGLEFLVAADIIRTVALNPTLQNVATLGVLIVIRTFLSWALLLEIEGRWPWQARAGSEQRG